MFGLAYSMQSSRVLCEYCFLELWLAGFVLDHVVQSCCHSLGLLGVTNSQAHHQQGQLISKVSSIKTRRGTQ